MILLDLDWAQTKSIILSLILVLWLLKHVDVLIMILLLREVSFASTPTRLPMSQFLAFEKIAHLRVVRCDKVSLHDLILVLSL